MEERTITVVCDTHGTQQTTIFRGVLDWGDATCPECERNERAARIKRDEERKRLLLIDAKQKQINARLARCGVGKLNATTSFEDFKPVSEGAAMALMEVKAYAENFEGMSRIGRNMIIIGNTGTGKTMLTCALVNYVIQHKDATAVRMNVIKAFDMVKNTFCRAKTNEKLMQALAFFIEPDLLVLDEIGVQFGSKTEKDILHHIVDMRREEVKPTIMISNYSLPVFEDFVGERVVSRMKENGGSVLVFDWQDQRGRV